MTLPADAHPRYDPYDPALLDDPYRAYRWLRDNDPVHRQRGRGSDGDFYVLSRFGDVWGAARDTSTFSSARGITFRDERRELGLAPTLVMLDPPEHTRPAPRRAP